MKKNIALIGLGGISQSVHLPLINRLHDQVNLVAVVDLSAKRSQEIANGAGANVQAFTSVDQLLQAVQNGLEVDGAVVASGGSHVPDTQKLLSAGIGVLSEKPLGYALEEHEALEKALEANNIDPAVRLRVGYMKEYDPAVQRAKELLKDVKIRSVHVEVLHPADGAQIGFANLRPATSDVDQEVLKEAGAPMRQALQTVLSQDVLENSSGDLDRLYPNVILGSIIHDIALLRHLVGPIGTVDYARHYGPEFPGSLAFAGTLEENGTPWGLDWHFIADYPQYQETVTIHHETGTIELLFDVPYLLNVATQLRTTDGKEDFGVSHNVCTWPQQEAFENEWRAFLALLDGNPVDGSSLPQSRKDIQTGQKMLRALAQTKQVSVPTELQ